MGRRLIQTQSNGKGFSEAMPTVKAKPESKKAFAKNVKKK